MTKHKAQSTKVSMGNTDLLEMAKSTSQASNRESVTEEKKTVAMYSRGNTALVSGNYITAEDLKTRVSLFSEFPFKTV